MSGAVVSQAAIDLCLSFEGADAHPNWPGGASGVTIGYGYDIGYNLESDLRSEWAALGADALDRLAVCCGTIGDAARLLAPTVSDIAIPPDVARQVFDDTSWPKAARQMLGVFNAGALPPDCQGALTSLVYNRGTSLDGDRRREMMQIAKALPTHPELVSDLILSMRRLWVGVGLDGLLRRREAEAALFESGLKG